MSTILYLTASIRPDDQSASRRIGGTLVETLSAAPGARVITRDLAANEIPFISWERFQANLTPAGERSAEQAALAAYADTLIDELKAADTIVIATPVYNFSAPATLKAWADLVARAGTTFRYTENGPVGLLEGKKAYIVAATGGTPIGAAFDYMSGWLTFFLGFIGIKDVTIIAADGLMGADGEAKIAAAIEQAANITTAPARAAA